MTGAPKVFIPITALPGALPGTAQWVSPFATGSAGGPYSEIRMISYTGIAAAAITLHIVPPGIAALPANAYLNALAVAINTTADRLYRSGEFILPAGYSIFAFSSVAAGINLIVCGADYTS